MRTSRKHSDIGMREVCLACGKYFGEHIGLRCPDGYKDFYSVTDCPAGYQLIELVDGEIRRVGPYKPIPTIPPEIHSSKPFDPQAAWEAVKALSKGS